MEPPLPSPRREVPFARPVGDWLRGVLTPRRRRRGSLVLAFLGGVLGTVVALWWWRDLPPDTAAPPATPREPAAAWGASEVRLVLHRVVPAADAADGVLQIEAALLHGRGDGTATVTGVHRPGGSVAIDAPALPVQLSVNRSYVPIRLAVSPRDCDLATEWTPSAQPFVLTWHDETGEVTEEVGGDHDAAMEIALIRHLDAACAR
ncbi:hypothetical protein KUV85_17125 [Nocardioides panacisoli]|uniref:hypothetical protein n=1 Tax=Nocardioides panacisoli TaxID=627624 RepID=UPI001C62C3CF|nr:hypothetical protein [Nocardioides panacisoli]QYJ04021.1 hypothetical protein KUV85_17125 [Nocardioides panacisoli]